MAGVLTAFIASLVICCVIAFMLGLFWFSDVRNRRFTSFFLLGIEVFVWTLLNAITMVCSAEYFPVIYTLRMALVCIVPFGVVWFVLDFTGSHLKNKMVRALFIALPALDILCMATNPLHHLYFLNYNYPVPARAPLFWVHTGMDFLFIILGFVVLIRFIIRGVRSHPVLILTGVAMLLPYTLNLLYSFGLIPFAHDTTPIGFFLTLILFVYAAYKLQLFNIKTALFSSTMDAVNDVILLFDKKLVLADLNHQARETFWDFSLRVGRTAFDDFCAWLDGHATSEDFARLIAAMKAGPQAEGECAVILSDGIPRSYALVWRTVYQRGKATGHILMLSDVSGYKDMIHEINQQNKRLLELKEQAEAASRAKGEFLSRMSHEMRTPMNAIIGMTQVALKDADAAGVQAPLEKIQGASGHLLGLINDVLDMSKIESGKFALDEGELTLAALLKNISVVADIHAEQKQQRFTIQLDENLPPALLVDGQRLTQVITNLLSNAFKFSPVGGEIGLALRLARRQEDEVLLQVEVRDNGIGITEEQQARLFRPFEQADGSISRHYGGTGLGLAISKSIVELMGGRIWVESTPGAGSCFAFTVRARAAQAAPGSPQAPDPLTPLTPADMAGRLAGCHILLAEDIEINREVIIALMDGSGVTFDIAENGRVACDKYLADPARYHMILMDIQMPEMDGFAATRAIRASGQPAAAAVPIIAMTANAFKEDVDACLAAGMDDHLAKPIEMERVLQIIGQYYSGAPAQ